MSIVQKKVIIRRTKLSNKHWHVLLPFRNLGKTSCFVSKNTYSSKKLKFYRKDHRAIKKIDGKISKFINEHGQNIANIMQVKFRVNKRTSLFVRQVSVNSEGHVMMKM